MPERDFHEESSELSRPSGHSPAEEGVSPRGQDASFHASGAGSETDPPDADGGSAGASETEAGNFASADRAGEADDGTVGAAGVVIAELPPAPDDPDLVALRQLMFQRELALLEQLNARLDDPNLHAKDVSNVVAEALLLRAHKDDKLARVLEPLVGKIFKHSLGKDRYTFANALFPIMGPAIRRSIAETFRSMLGSLNKSVEMSLSWKGLRWRIEAWRTDKPFSEVVLLHTLVYRVEQIFFIHGATGLVLAHVVDDGVASQDADMVSAMLTAIQDFVRDCFTGDNDSSLEQLQLEEFTILVEKSPLAYLACVVRGTPPVEFRQKLRSTLELLLVDCGDALDDYNGDSTPFLPARQLLEDCLESRFVEEDQALPFWIKALPAAAVLFIALGLGLWFYSKHQSALTAERARQIEEERTLAQKHSRGAVVDALRKEPGILVMDVVEKKDRPWELICLRDELARPFDAIVQEAGGRLGDFTIAAAPYVSFEPEIVTLRVKRELVPPEGVRVEYQGNGILRLSGEAPLQWILRAKQEGRIVPGIKRVVIDDLNDPRLADLLSMVKEVESSIMEFPLGKEIPVPADLPKLEKTVETLTKIENLASRMGITVGLAVYGYADASGRDKRNFELSQGRARTLAAMLYARGSKLRISVYGMSAEYAQRFRANLSGDLPDRRLELQIHLEPQNPDMLERLKTD